MSEFRPRRRSWSLSPLTSRIMAVNLSALLILSLSFLYTTQYERTLIGVELESLLTVSQMVSAALSEAADGDTLRPAAAQRLVQRLMNGSPVRVIVFSPQKEIVADSHSAATEDRGLVPLENILPALRRLERQRQLNPNITMLLSWLPTRLELPVYASGPAPAEVTSTVGGVWRDAQGNMLLGISTPVQGERGIAGMALTTRSGIAIDLAVQEVQIQALEIALWVLLITTLVSLYLAMEITYPIMRLSRAADDVRRSLTPQEDLVRLAKRDDEIGLLSESFLDMTQSLNERMDAIKSFAADVAHEIKNPLASVRSAIETLPRIEDADKRARLLSIIAQDILRIDRLISDISAASRLDSELRHGERANIDLRDLVKSLAESLEGRADVDIDLDLRLPQAVPLVASVNDGQISQVFLNLLTNAASFTPAGGKVTGGGEADRSMAVLWVENEGPPVSESKLEKIFERFYSERPSSEKFGLHSGLGLSISRQIVKAHGGAIYADNRQNADGSHRGVRFTVVLPLAREGDV